MKEWATKKGTKVYRVQNGRSNAYIASAAGRCILVDTGKKRPLEMLVGRIGGMGIWSVDALILTHSHYDHAENASGLKRHYHAPIVIHRGDAEFLAEGDSPVPRGSIAVTRLLSEAFGGIIQPYLRFEPAQPDIVVGERFDLACFGIGGYTLHTPGHSPGSMSVIIDDEIAIVGDAMLGVYPGSIFIPFADDVPEMVRSWKKLLDTGCRVFLPGHGSEDAAPLVRRQYERYRKKYGL